MPRVKRIGVYGIFAGDLCLYVGQSVDMEGRWRTHRGKLRNGSHREDFQEFFSGALAGDLSSLEFRVLAEIRKRDQHELNRLECEFFEGLSPRFYGQVPSKRNSYLRTAPEGVERGRRRTRELLRRSSRGFRMNSEGVRIWERSCVQCRGEFDGFSPTSVYCSSECRERSKLVAKECQGCGVSMEVKSELTRWCERCKRSQRNKECVCITCGEDFMSARSTTKYCSPRCKRSPGLANLSSLSDRRYPLTCVFCGVPFLGRSGNARYCSQECRSGG